MLRILSSRLVTSSRYLGQCDTLRRRGGCNEELWQQMMQEAIPIRRDQFAQYVVDLSPILDEDETIDDFGLDDPETGFYVSKWGDQSCYFAKTRGFEFIWLA